MAFRDTIDALYKVISPSQPPRAPQDKFYIYVAADELITAVLTAHSINPIAAVQNVEIEKAILFILRFIKTPEKLRGASLIEKTVRHLISQAFDEINAPKPDIMTMMAIQDAWFATLKKNEADFETIYAKRPRVEDSISTSWLPAWGTIGRFHASMQHMRTIRTNA
jgi:hypothetical protein